LDDHDIAEGTTKTEYWKPFAGPLGHPRVALKMRGSITVTSGLTVW